MTAATSSPTEAARARALAWIDQAPKRLLIGGQWVDTVSGKTFETVDFHPEVTH